MARRFFKRYKKLEDDKVDTNISNSKNTDAEKPKSNVGFFDLANNLSKALVECNGQVVQLLVVNNGINDYPFVVGVNFGKK